MAEVASSGKCFVIMPFEAPFPEYYSEIYWPAIEGAGLTAIQSAEIFSPGMFMSQVVEGIQSSTVILAELTGRNANVFYELGLAHAYRKPVVMVTQEKNDVPSDLQGLRWIGYRTVSPRWAEELRRQISGALLTCVEAGPIERMRRFLPAAVQTVEVKAIADRLVELSATQRTIFDVIRLGREFVTEKDLLHKCPHVTDNIHYRLEVMRLSGLIESKVVDKAGTRYPVYAYRLSPEASAYLDGHAAAG